MEGGKDNRFASEKWRKNKTTVKCVCGGGGGHHERGKRR